MDLSFRRNLFAVRGLLAASLAASLGAGNAWAGAWLQDAGSGQVITSYSHYSTDTFFNGHGDRTHQTSSYRKDMVDVYAEYGLAPAYTIGIQPSYQWVRSSSASGTLHNSGLGDTPFFLRERLWHNDSNVLSVQELATLPGPYNRHSPVALGYGQSDVELRALYGHSGTVAKLAYFTDAEAAYRQRFDGPADEVRLDMTLGVKPLPGLTILGQSFNTIGLRNASATAFVTPTGPDYDLSKLQLSGVVEVPYDFSVQVGGAVDVSGRNTGGGKTVFVALWRGF